MERDPILTNEDIEFATILELENRKAPSCSFADMGFDGGETVMPLVV